LRTARINAQQRAWFPKPNAPSCRSGRRCYLLASYSSPCNSACVRRTKQGNLSAI